MGTIRGSLSAVKVGTIWAELPLSERVLALSEGGIGSIGATLALSEGGIGPIWIKLPLSEGGIGPIWATLALSEGGIGPIWVKLALSEGGYGPGRWIWGQSWPKPCVLPLSLIHI